MGCEQSTEAVPPPTSNSTGPTDTTEAATNGSSSASAPKKTVGFAAEPEKPDRISSDKQMKNKEKSVGQLMHNDFAKSVIRKPNDANKAQEKKTGHLKNIFAKPLDIISGYKAPVYPKTPTEKKFIQNAFKNNFVFQNMEEKEETTLINAFEKFTVEKPGTKIIEQGDTNADYFYILDKGQVDFVINDKVVGTANPGKSFGELSLLYTSPRAASCITSKDCHYCVLWRLDQKTFKSILQSGTSEESDEKKRLLKDISFVRDLQNSDVNKLVDALQHFPFSIGDQIVTKGEKGDAFYVIKEGEVKVTDTTVGDSKFEDQILKSGPNGFFGERALTHDEPRAANIIAVTNGMCYKVDAKTFREVLGNLDTLMLRAEDERALKGIKSFNQTSFDDADYIALTSVITNHAFESGRVIVKEGQRTAARLYLVREGEIEISSKQDPSTFSGNYTKGSFFGEDQLLVDNDSDDHDTNLVSKYTIKVVSEEAAVIGCLLVSDARNVVDTSMIGKDKKSIADLSYDDISYDELDRRSILGAGTFGQVWLCTRKHSDPEKAKVPYALKIQSKYELVQNSQAKGVINERNIMSQLKSQFVIPLLASYQDTQRVYLLLKVLQGGELYSLMYPDSGASSVQNGVGEASAKFYSACILEGLSYMHRRNILYRDLKPENVLIDSNGYPVIIDLGFAKVVTDKTFTLCGTPLYLAPEVIMNRGHDKGADHWSLGVLIYEMIVGDTPFYQDGMDQIQLFRRICKASFTFPRHGPASKRASPDAERLIKGLLTPKHTNRLGSLANGIKDIYKSSWYENRQNGIADRISFSKLRRMEIKAPWIPKIKGALDVSNFETWDGLQDKGKQRDPKLTPEQQKMFKDFPQI